jgi:hypothetical protein
MDLPFLKNFKTQNNIMIQQLKDYVVQCDLIISQINENLPYTCHTVDLTNFYNRQKNIIQFEIQPLERLEENINKEIYKLCEHQFLKDLVELDPESEPVHVEYCVDCELNKENRYDFSC